MRERANATRYTPDAVNVHRAGAMWEIASLAVEYQRSWSAQVLREKVQNAKPGEENSERTRFSFTEGGVKTRSKYCGDERAGEARLRPTCTRANYRSILTPKIINHCNLGTRGRGGATRCPHWCIALHSPLVSVALTRKIGCCGASAPT